MSLHYSHQTWSIDKFSFVGWWIIEGLCNQCTWFFMDNKVLYLVFNTTRYSGSGKNWENVVKKKIGKNPGNYGIQFVDY